MEKSKNHEIETIIRRLSMFALSFPEKNNKTMMIL